MTSTFSVVLFSSRRDHFYDAVSFLAASRARGKRGILFLRGPALKAFVDGKWDARPVPGDLDVEEILSEIQGKGRVVVYACSAWARMLKIEPKKLAAGVDAVVGLTTFLSQAESGPILYI